MNSFHILAPLTVSSSSLQVWLSLCLYILFMAKLEAVGFQVNELTFKCTLCAAYIFIFKHRRVSGIFPRPKVKSGCVFVNCSEWKYSQTMNWQNDKWVQGLGFAAVMLNFACTGHLGKCFLLVCWQTLAQCVDSSRCSFLFQFVVFNQFGGLYGITIVIPF